MNLEELLEMFLDDLGYYLLAFIDVLTELVGKFVS